jgi:hypothetical protein
MPFHSLAKSWQIQHLQKHKLLIVEHNICFSLFFFCNIHRVQHRNTSLDGEIGTLSNLILSCLLCSFMLHLFGSHLQTSLHHGFYLNTFLWLLFLPFFFFTWDSKPSFMSTFFTFSIKTIVGIYLIIQINSKSPLMEEEFSPTWGVEGNAHLKEELSYT